MGQNINFVPAATTDLFHSFWCTVLLCVCYKAEASVKTCHGVHHQPQIPDCAALFEQGDEFVLKDILGDFPTEDLYKNMNITIKWSKYL